MDVKEKQQEIRCWKCGEIEYGRKEDFPLPKNLAKHAGFAYTKQGWICPICFGDWYEEKGA